jgi:hypothetical protein
VADSVEISIIQFNQKTKTDEETVTVTSNSFYLEMVQGRVSLRGKGRLIGCLCSASASVSITRVDIICGHKKKIDLQFSFVERAMMKSVQMLACPRPDDTACLKTILHHR